MFGISIIKSKELRRLRDIDETFVSIIENKKEIFESILKSKDESIDSLKIRIEQLKIKRNVP